MLTCTVEHGELRFHRKARRSGWQDVWTMETAALLNASEGQTTEKPNKLAKESLKVLLVPDYWLTTRTYKLQTKKKSVVDAFLTRKLKDELSGMPGAEAFFSYRFFSSRAGENRIHTVHLQEPAVLDLYAALQRLGLAPWRITSPALLWEMELRQLFPTFDQERSALLHIVDGECFQYFFDRGRFLFSRNLALAPLEPDGAVDFADVIFEATQSQRLYAQKTQTEVSVFYLLAATNANAPDAEFFAKGLGKTVVDLTAEESVPATLRKLCDCDSNAIAREFIRTTKLTRIPGVSHIATERELFWRPIQWSGIAAGLVATACAGAVFASLWSMSVTTSAALPGSGSLSASERRQALAEYETALDQVLADATRPNIVRIALHASAAIPPQIRVYSIKAETSDTKNIEIIGEVDAGNTRELEATLGTFIDHLHQELPNTATLSLSDITVNRVATDAISNAVATQAPRFSFKLELPAT